MKVTLEQIKDNKRLKELSLNPETAIEIEGKEIKLLDYCLENKEFFYLVPLIVKSCENKTVLKLFFKGNYVEDEIISELIIAGIPLDEISYRKEVHDQNTQSIKTEEATISSLILDCLLPKSIIALSSKCPESSFFTNNLEAISKRHVDLSKNDELQDVFLDLYNKNTWNFKLKNLISRLTNIQQAKLFNKFLEKIVVHNIDEFDEKFAYAAFCQIVTLATDLDPKSLSLLFDKIAEDKKDIILDKLNGEVIWEARFLQTKKAENLKKT